jgi:hypothetical protein
MRIPTLLEELVGRRYATDFTIESLYMDDEGVHSARLRRAGEEYTISTEELIGIIKAGFVLEKPAES